MPRSNKSGKPLLDLEDRRSPAFWQKNMTASGKRLLSTREDYVRVSKIYRGDMSDLLNPQDAASPTDRWPMALDNMTQLAIRRSRSDLFFRYPRFTSTPVSSLSRVFTEDFCQVEATYLNWRMRQIGFRKQARRVILDARIGAFGVMKTVFDRDISIDEDKVRVARQEARLENTLFLSHGEKMMSNPDQLHSFHIDEHSQLLAAAQKGEIDLPREAINYIKKHIKVHKAMSKNERPTETIRSASVSLVRVNPLFVDIDPVADDYDEALWTSHTFLARKADVLNNDDYDQAARDALGTTTDRFEFKTPGPSVPSSGSFDIPEDMVMLREVVDRIGYDRNPTVILYADGGEIPLEVKPYSLTEIDPNGPFTFLSFMEDPFEGFGVSPAKAWLSEQAALSKVQAATIAAAIQTLPKMLYNVDMIDKDQVDLAMSSPAGSATPVKIKGDPNRKVEDAIGQMPPVEIPEQQAAVVSDLRHTIERFNGGSTNMGGGDQSNTATASALVADASTSIAEDDAATVDEFSAACAKKVARFHRKFAVKAEIIDVCGDAGNLWPEEGMWADRDIINDIGIDITPGSSRRKNTAIDQKQLTDVLLGLASDPAFQGPAGMNLRVEGWRRLCDDAGLTGLPFGPVSDEIKMIAMAGQQDPNADPNAQDGDGSDGETGGDVASEGPGGPQGASQGVLPPGSTPGSGAPPQTQPRGSSASQAGISQGIANVGGGRIGTGASRGDLLRLTRQTAKANVTGRT